MIVAPWMPLLYVALAGCLAALVWVWRVRRQPPVEFDLDHDVRWWLWHYFTGSGLALAPAQTNEAGEVIEPLGHLLWRSRPWLHIGKAPDEPMVPRLGRAAGRTSLVAAVVLFEYMRAGAGTWGAAPTVLLAVGYGGAVVIGLAALAVAEAATAVAICLWWKLPAAKALAKPAGWDEGKWPGLVFGWIRIRVRHGKFQVKVRLAQSFKDQDAPRKLVVDQAQGRLELGEDPDTKWRLRSWSSHVWISPARVVPHRADYREPYVHDAIEQYSGDGVWVPAIMRGKEATSHHHDQDAPHGLLSASTIGGKSATLMLAGAQLYRHGAYVAICDIKMSSHRAWAIDHATEQPLPGIVYADEAHEIAHVLETVGHLAEVRNAWAKQMLNRGLAPDFDRIVLLLDEMNGMMDALRAGGHHDAIRYYRRLLWMGRVVKINIIASGQRMDAEAAGGGAARECYGWRCLAEYSEQTYGIVAPQAEKIACVPHKEQPGWCVIVYGREAFEAQRIWMEPPDAQQLALRRTAPTDGPRHGGTYTPARAWAELTTQLALPAGREHGLLLPVDGHQQPGSHHYSWQATERIQDQDPGQEQDQQVRPPEAPTTATTTTEHDACHDPQGSRLTPGGTVLTFPGTWGQPPEGPGVMGPDPQPHATRDDPSSTQSHSPRQPGPDVPPAGPRPMARSGGVVGGPAGSAVPDEWVTLREIAERKLLPVPSLNAIRQQSKRPGFPEGRQRRGTTAKEYPRAEVVTWWYVGRPLSPENRDVFDPGCYVIVPGYGAEDPQGTVIIDGTRRRGLRWGDTAKIGYTEDLPQRCRSYTNPLTDVVVWEQCWGPGDRREDPAARVQAAQDREDELHHRYRHERLYAKHEFFEVRGQLAADLGVPAPTPQEVLS